MASSCGSSYASSLETTNYAHMCRIVVDVLRDILWQVLTNEILPTDLSQKVQIDIKKLGNLNLKIKTWLCGISPPSTEIPSTEKFDVSSLYTLIRNLCSQVPTPSTQWGQIPPAGGITLGDDIERIREFRNTLYGHATQAKIENADFNKLCIEIKDVASRFDAYFCSLSKAMKCDFQCEIDTILTCFMDKSLEDDYIEKMKEIAILSDVLVVVKQQAGDLTKKVDSVHDAIYDLQTEKDKVENTTDSLVYEERDCNENAGNSREDIALEMPQGMEGKICIIKCYANLKLELERDIVMDIAKCLFKKKKDTDVLEEIAKAETRRLCIDRLLKRVLQLEATGLKSFFDLLKMKCPEGAQKLAKIKVTDKEKENFTQVSISVKMVPPRIQNGLKFEQLDVEFFQCKLLDIPEKVDQIADVLLSQFHISICNHSQLMLCNDPVEKMHALLEKVQSCHFDSDSEVQSILGSSLYNGWQSFRDDGSRQANKAVSKGSKKLTGMDMDDKPCKPVSMYKDKLLITGLNEMITEDCLINFLEARGGVSPTETLYAEDDEKMALGSFGSPPDLQKLQDACQKKKLHGATLVISQVPISKCVLVTILATKTFEDTVQLYFENARCSGGGSVEKVEMNKEAGECLIFFEDLSGGSVILNECAQLKRQKLMDGDVVYTKGGNLKCKIVAHGVSPIWQKGAENEEEYLKEVVLKSLEETDRRRLTSIGIPAIGTGIFGWPTSVATLVIVRTVQEYFQVNISSVIKNVYLCDLDAEHLKAFIDAVKQAFPTGDLTFHEGPSQIATRGSSSVGTGSGKSG